MTVVMVSQEGPVRTIAVNRPEVLNALNDEVLTRLAEEMRRADADPEVRVVVVTGSGDRAFIAGGDIGYMATLPPIAAEEVANAVKRAVEEMRRCRKPVIAAINGFCLGGGLEIALGCDIRVAGDNAVLGLPEIGLGILPGGGGSVRLSRLIGASAARFYCLTGEKMTAARAFELGLLGWVVPAAEFREAVRAQALRLAALSGVALAQMKSLLDVAVDADLHSADVAESKAFALCFASPDQREGMSAFLEKRAPRFEGAWAKASTSPEKVRQ